MRQRDRSRTPLHYMTYEGRDVPCLPFPPRAVDVAQQLRGPEDHEGAKKDERQQHVLQINLRGGAWLGRGAVVEVDGV